MCYNGCRSRKCDQGRGKPKGNEDGHKALLSSAGSRLPVAWEIAAGHRRYSEALLFSRPSGGEVGDGHDSKGDREMTDLVRMDKTHPRWTEFCMTLGGPLCCNFHTNEDGKITWTCNSETDRPFAHAIIEKIGGIDIPATMAYFDECGGFCDCEILFNVAG